MSAQKKRPKGINPAFFSKAQNTGDQSLSSTDAPKLKQAVTLVPEILEGNYTALSRGITLVESTSTLHQKEAETLIEQCLPYAGKAVRLGITGVPGVGKSTLIEALGGYLTALGKKVAVLAIDPSSSVSRGSILGDKTRMAQLSQNPLAFIRPSASGDSLGGVARKTREAMILCEAAGFDVIIVETVGVGQSEHAVHSMVDFFLLLKLAGAGDELQGIKRGIIEMADAIVINKADGDNKTAARMAKSAFAKALHLYPPKESGWSPKVALCSALEEEGIAEIWKEVTTYLQHTKANGFFSQKRAEQNKYWLVQTIENALKDQFYSHPDVAQHLTSTLDAVARGDRSPFQAAKALLARQKTR